MMFEGLEGRVAARAEARARVRAEDLAGRLEAALPRGLSAAADEAGVAISGRGARRRFATDARLRWLTLEVLR